MKRSVFARRRPSSAQRPFGIAESSSFSRWKSSRFLGFPRKRLTVIAPLRARPGSWYSTSHSAMNERDVVVRTVTSSCAARREASSRASDSAPPVASSPYHGVTIATRSPPPPPPAGALRGGGLWGGGGGAGGVALRARRVGGVGGVPPGPKQNH